MGRDIRPPLDLFNSWKASLIPVVIFSCSFGCFVDVDSFDDVPNRYNIEGPLLSLLLSVVRSIISFVGVMETNDAADH